MPVAKTLLEYLSDPAVELPQRKTLEEAVQEILRILNQPEREGGATYSLYFGDQLGEPCFAVALDNRLTQRLPASVNLAQVISDFVELNQELLISPRCSIGIWAGVNANGAWMLFLDVTVLVYNESVAYAFGVESNQIAIFDLKRGVELDTGGTGLPVPGTPPPGERLRQLEARDRIGSEEGEGDDDGNSG